MAELSTIARPYAEALFQAANSSAKSAADAWLPLVESIATAASHPQVASVAADPRLSDAQIYDLLVGFVSAPLPDELATFLKLVIENDRLATLPEVALQFRKLKNDADGSADCLIETAFALSEAQLAELITLLPRKFPRRLKPQTRVEPRLIGGVRVTVGDQVLDSSVLARLDAMRVQLTA
jgi:F-type H+-transporting ATPase subunit delta